MFANFSMNAQLCLFFKQQHPETVNYEKILHIARAVTESTLPSLESGKKRRKTSPFARSFHRFSRHDPAKDLRAAFKRRALRVYLYTLDSRPLPRRIAPSRLQVFSSRLNAKRGCAKKLKCENNVLFFISHSTPNLSEMTEPFSRPD